jgi:hypothetical protein
MGGPFTLINAATINTCPAYARAMIAQTPGRKHSPDNTLFSTRQPEQTRKEFRKFYITHIAE